MPPWAQEIFASIVGPWGAVFVLCLALYFLWKLFREEQHENRENFKTVGFMVAAVNEATAESRAAHAEVKEWRDVFIMDEPRARRKTT